MDTGDALLAVQHLVLVRRHLIEVDQPERIALEQRMNHRLFPLAAAIGIEIVALVFRLNGQLAAQSEQALALQLVVNKPVTDVGDGDVGSQGGFHC